MSLMFRGYLLLLSLFLIFSQAGCKKESVALYEVKPVTLYQSSSEKRSIKSETELIAIAYSDLFGRSIPIEMLQALQLPYVAMGDKQVIIDLIIRNFLRQSQVQIPTSAQMRDQPEWFIEQAYLQLYKRYPDEFEIWKLKQMIAENTDLRPDLIYYSMMTADEYRFY